jgi:hypothetical protein
MMYCQSLVFINHYKIIDAPRCATCAFVHIPQPSKNADCVCCYAGNMVRRAHWNCNPPVEPNGVCDQWKAQEDRPMTYEERQREEAVNRASEIIPLPPGEHRSNAGQECDMLRGPCSCGAWHDGTEPTEKKP